MKINPITLVTALAVGAAGAFGFLYLRPTEPFIEAEAAPVVLKSEAPKAEVKLPEEQLAMAAVSSPPPSVAPSFDAVNVEAGGSAVISGRAAANADVVAKLNGTVIATAKSNSLGEFVMVPEKPLPVGVGTLSLETKSAGTVQASSGTVSIAVKEPAPNGVLPKPPSLAPKVVTAQASAVVELAPPAPPQPTRIVIQPGNNLWTLSRDLYGAGRDFTVIYEANKNLIRNPGLIYPGQVISAPVAPIKTP